MRAVKGLYCALICLLGLTNSAAMAQSASAIGKGKGYFAISNDKSSASTPSEVIEFFSYGCSHCAEYQPQIDTLTSQLPATTRFRLVPVIFNPQWEAYSRAFFAAEALGVLSRSHQALFDELHDKHAPLASLDELALRFYRRYGVDPKHFVEVANSAEVTHKINESYRLAVAYGVDRTPTLTVNGRYRIVLDESHGLTGPRTVDLALALIDK